MKNVSVVRPKAIYQQEKHAVCRKRRARRNKTLCASQPNNLVVQVLFAAYDRRVFFVAHYIAAQTCENACSGMYLKKTCYSAVYSTRDNFLSNGRFFYLLHAVRRMKLANYGMRTAVQPLGGDRYCIIRDWCHMHGNDDEVLKGGCTGEAKRA